MGKGGNIDDPQMEKSSVTWDEVKKHATRDDKWLVIEGEVYNITNWAERHPGGKRVIGHYAGQDASEAFRAFHTDLGTVKKYLKPLHVGKLEGFQELEIQTDVRDLRVTAEKLGLFDASATFFILQILQLCVLEFLAVWIVYHYGNGWLPVIVSCCLFATMESQSGYLAHDFGHLSVFKSNFWNHVGLHYSLAFLKGASCHWWNNLHSQHHAKPNVINKDPDVKLEALFVVGDTMPKRMAESNVKTLPYNWQHHYFFVMFPPLLYPVYFTYKAIRYPIIHKKWLDFTVMMMYIARILIEFTPVLGLGGAVLYHFVAKSLESCWFVWVTQANHIPMEISDDKERPWLPLQLYATCNIDPSFFNDWFTGHLNFQIEHHIFPSVSEIYLGSGLCIINPGENYELC